MNMLSVREMKLEDASRIVDYFVDADRDFLIGMGADPDKLPSKESWLALLENELNKPLKEKEFYYIIWQINGQAVGHCNINKIEFGDKATMHLHLWDKESRKSGNGYEFMKMTLPYFFTNFQLKTVVCEPYAENPAPNRMLHKLGFEYKGPITKTPGWINFHQTVNHYELSHKNFSQAD
ncbi:MAG: GNAT family N-acetyltransferase [Saprospiraceae bacterium]|nr:GNAT family N-acetyltransferase [Saprospiraceae bacterium]